MKKVLVVAVAILSCKLAGAIGLSCQDFDTILCANFEDGQGLVARDLSRSGLTWTLNGGPIWEPKVSGMNLSGTTFNVSKTSITQASFPPRFLYFVGINGEDVTTNSTSLFDFSGNKPWMLCVMYKFDGNAGAAPYAFINWTQGGNACGWTIETENTNRMLIYMPTTNVDYWTERLMDRKPHTLGIWVDGSGNTDLYFDGRLSTSYTAQADMTTCAGGSALNIAKAKTGATGEWIGGVGPFQIWKAAIKKPQAAGFFKAWHDQWFR